MWRPRLTYDASLLSSVAVPSHWANTVVCHGHPITQILLTLIWRLGKIFTVAVTLVVGTGAISGIALASVDHTFYPDRLENPKLSLPSPGVGSGIPAPYRIGDKTNEPSVSLPSPGVGS